MYTKLTRLSCALLLFLLFRIVGTAQGIDPTKLPDVSTNPSPKYYVIRLSYPIGGNTYYVRCFPDHVGDNRITMYPYNDSKYGFTQSSESNDNYLWYFVNGTKTDTETACQISNAAVSGKYLKHDKEYLDNIGTYDSSTSHKWYIRKHPHNYLGLGICQSDTYTGANFWVYDKSGSYHVIKLAATNGGEVEHSEATTWIILSYEDLVEEANSLGVTGYSTTGTEAEKFSSVITAIESFKKSHQGAAFNISDGDYLIRSRKYHTYLTMLENNVKGIDGKLLTSSIWNIRKNSDGTYTLRNNADRDSLMKVNNTTHIYTKVVSDGDINYLRFDDSNGGTPSTLRIGDNGTTNAKTSRDLNFYADFELIPYTSVSDIPADMLVQGELAAAEEELTDQSDKHRYFRIANYLQPERFVEDVDHEIYEYKTTQTYGDVEKHADNIMGDGYGDYQYCEWYDSKHNPMVDIFVKNRDFSHINNLWEFELVLAKDGSSLGDDHATGVIRGDNPHNLYRIRNVNSGKYIGEPKTGNIYLPLTRTKTEAAIFWLEYRENGQYAIILRDNANSINSPVAKGYMSLKRNADVSGLMDGGIEWVSTTSANNATANSKGAWYLHKAPFVELEMNNAKAKGDGSPEIEYSWATIYLPFTARLPLEELDNGVKMYKAKWDSEKKKLQMKATGESTAYQGLFVAGPQYFENESSEGNSVYKGEDGNRIRIEIADNISVNDEFFADNAFEGVTEGEGTSFYNTDIESKWGVNKGYKEYYVIGSAVVSGEGGDGTVSTDKVKLRLQFPWGPYLYANKAFVRNPAEPGSSANAVVFLEFSTMSGNPDTTSEIEEINAEPSKLQTNIYYDLSGRRVEHPRKGIYIVNGKKIVIR